MWPARRLTDEEAACLSCDSPFGDRGRNAHRRGGSRSTQGQPAAARAADGGGESTPCGWERPMRGHHRECRTGGRLASPGCTLRRNCGIGHRGFAQKTARISASARTRPTSNDSRNLEGCHYPSCFGRRNAVNVSWRRILLTRMIHESWWRGPRMPARRPRSAAAAVAL